METPARQEVAPHVLQALEDQLTDDMIMRLTAYAFEKQRRRVWQGAYGGEMPNGMEPGDLVVLAVEKVLDGRRKWDPEKAPDLFEYLSSVIDSDVYHLVRGVPNRRIRRESTLSRRNGNGDERSTAFLDEVPAEGPNPEEAIREKEAEEFFWRLHDDVAGDPLLQGILECVFEGISKPKEMAEILGVKTKEINNAKKRLRRRIERSRLAENVDQDENDRGRGKQGEEGPQ